MELFFFSVSEFLRVGVILVAPLCTKASSTVPRELIGCSGVSTLDHGLPSFLLHVQVSFVLVGDALELLMAPGGNRLRACSQWLGIAVYVYSSFILLAAHWLLCSHVAPQVDMFC